MRGEPSGELAPTAFINFLQNHDQIGNRALGDRLESVAGPEAIEAALAITLLAPAIPMLFMGEEWGSKAPFPFFCDFKGDLAEAVRKGRRREYAWAYAKYGDEVPDPLDAIDLSIRRAGLAIARHRRDKSGWRWCGTCSRSAAREIVPRLAGARFGDAHAADNGLLTADWRLGDGADAAADGQSVDRRGCPPRQWNNRHPDLGRRARRCRDAAWSVFWRLEAR